MHLFSHKKDYICNIVSFKSNLKNVKNIRHEKNVVSNDDF